MREGGTSCTQARYPPSRYPKLGGVPKKYNPKGRHNSQGVGPLETRLLPGQALISAVNTGALEGRIKVPTGTPRSSRVPKQPELRMGGRRRLRSVLQLVTVAQLH